MNFELANKDKFENWKPDDRFSVVKSIDLHTAGEPLRIIYDGLPDIEGNSVLDIRRILREKCDFIRTSLMWEPRGHADMYGCILTKPFSKDADFGVVFMHNEGYSTMCGHGIIGAAKAALELGLVEKQKPITKIGIDSPAGFVQAYAIAKNDFIDDIYFHNVPSFVYSLDNKIDVEGIGNVKFDIAFGGAFYAYVDADSINVSLKKENFRSIINIGMKIKNKIMKEREIKYPFEDDLSFLYGVIFIGKSENEGADSRNVCIFADGEVDRSPTGTGVSGRMALHYKKGEIGVGQEMVIESIIGSQFRAKVFKTTAFANFDAVIPEVHGNAYICGKNEFLIDKDDDLKYGFFLR